MKTTQNIKILVTGGAGFIGSNLVDKLLEQNNTVNYLDNFATSKLENLKTALTHAHFTLIEGDIRNYYDCQKAVKGCNYVLHQAALGSVPRSIAAPMTSSQRKHWRLCKNALCRLRGRCLTFCLSDQFFNF